MSFELSMRSISLCLARVLAALITFVLSLWMFGALSFDGPGIWLTALLMLGLSAVMIWKKFHWQAWATWGVCFLTTIIWWLSLKPPAYAKWQADVAKNAHVEVDGDLLTFHNVRDFEYRNNTDFTPRWSTRQVKLSSLRSMDIAINYWGSPWMAHPIISFQFFNAPPLAFSIETRKRVGQSYSAIGGLYRQYSLICVVAEERDLLGVRALHRKGEDIFLYRTTLSAEKARIRLMDYVSTIQSLNAKPRWYNAITSNCTTGIRSQHKQEDRIPWDWRILVNGKGDEMMYEIGALKTDGLSFTELKKRAHANAEIIEAYSQPDFSSQIRVNR